MEALSASEAAVSRDLCSLLLERRSVLCRPVYHGSIHQDNSPDDRTLVIDWVLWAVVPGRLLDGGPATEGDRLAIGRLSQVTSGQPNAAIVS